MASSRSPRPSTAPTTARAGVALPVSGSVPSIATGWCAWCRRETEMRFGCSFWLDRDPRQAARFARAAEEAGFQDVWFPDHYFIREVYAALALAATATTRVGLGTAVTSPYLRHPVLLASAVATIDEISGGRAILGLGVGGHEFPSQLNVSLARP